MTSCFLDVSEGNARVQGGGNEGMAESMGSNALYDAGFAGDAVHDPGGSVTVETSPVGVEEQRALAAFADREVDGAGRSGREWDDYGLAALAQNGQGAVSSFETERLDVRTSCFRDP